jgi:hypothetical protein
MYFQKQKRVLLTDYADKDAIMMSINKIKIDYYLTKPWDPPEEHLYSALNDLLDDWWASFRPPFEGIKVIGLRWSPRSHEIKEFLARNSIPFQWLDIEGDEEARRLVSFANSTRSDTDINCSITTNTISSDNSSSSTINNNNTDNNNTAASSSSIAAATPPLSTSSSSYFSSLHLPLVIFPDGSYIAEPTNLQIAEKLVLRLAHRCLSMI